MKSYIHSSLSALLLSALLLTACGRQDTTQVPTAPAPASLAATTPATVTVTAYDPVQTGDDVLIPIGLSGDHVRLFGMNVRFVYPSDRLALIGFTDYAPGYGPMSPDPPIVNILKTGVGHTLFRMPGKVSYVNGAVQLLDDTQPPVYTTTDAPTRYFSIAFKVLDGQDCPPILILDKERIPARGGFPPGSAGVVVTIVAPPGGRYQSAGTITHCRSLHWECTSEMAPYGAPTVPDCLAL